MCSNPLEAVKLLGDDSEMDMRMIHLSTGEAIILLVIAALVLGVVVGKWWGGC